MKKMLEAKPTASQLIRKTKFWLGCRLLLTVALPLVTAYAAADGERHVYAKVFVEGTGVKHEFSYMRDVYLDVVVIPTETVVEQDSGILFTDSNYKKSLSEIQVRALEFVEPHVKELGFETVSDYQVFLYPGDKDKVHFDLTAVEKFRSDSLAIESKLSGPKAELHGVWIGATAEPTETKQSSVDEKTVIPEKSPKVESAPAVLPTQKPTSTTEAENGKVAAKKKKLIEKRAEEDKRKAYYLAKNRAEAEKARAKLKEDKIAKQRAEGKVVKEMIFDDFIQESQLHTWCGRIAAQVLKSLEANNHKLISMGSCSCKPGGDPGSPKKEFHCGFPVTYRLPPNNAK